MTIFIICMVIVVLAMGIVGGIYILGLKDAINEKDSKIKKLESDLEWWQEYCNDITADKTTIINTHENRLKELEREIDAKNNEILLLERKLLEKEGVEILTPIPEGTIYKKVELKPEDIDENVTDSVLSKVKNIIALREATKDLDFPPVDKEE